MKNLNTELQNLLIEALKERFKAHTIVEAIEEKIKSIAINKTFERYKNEILLNDGLEFELIGVTAHFDTYTPSEVETGNVELRLAFFCKSKLPKEKREKLERAKLGYEKNNHLRMDKCKIPIWKELCYDVELENVLYGNINLCIM